MTATILFYGAVAFGVATFFVWAFVNSGSSPNKPLPRRIIWIPILIVIWPIGSAQLALVSTHRCVVENSGRAPKGNNYYDYVDCSLELLSGNALDNLLFVWTWLPLMILVVFCTRYLGQFGRERFGKDRPR